MRRRAQRVAGVWPEVKRRRVRCNLHAVTSTSVQFSSYPAHGMTCDTHPVIPDRNRVRLPVEAHLEVGVLAQLAEQQLQHCVGLGLRHTDDAARETCGTEPMMGVSDRSGPGAEGARSPGFTYTLFQPVAGWTRTTGWIDSTGSRRTGRPDARAPSAWATALWTAERPSRYFWKLGLNEE